MKKKIKKLVAIIFCLILAIGIYIKDNYLNNRQEATFAEIIDGDSFYLNIDNKKTEVRLIGINCPEMKSHEPYAEEATNLSYKLLKEANKIEIEFDDESDRQDKYGRYLIYVYIDNELLQLKLLDEGLAEVKYVYGDYKYLDQMRNAESIAKNRGLNMWSGE